MRRLDTLVSHGLLAGLLSIVLVSSMTLMAVEEVRAQDTYKLITRAKGKGKNKRRVTIVVGGVDANGSVVETQSKTTKKNGKVIFKDLVPGTYTVTASKSGRRLIPASREVVITTKNGRAVFRVKRDARAVGVTSCSTCHGSSEQYTDWSAGVHANLDGSPALASLSKSCYSCHRPSKKDGGVTGCESCHGGGKNHRKNPSKRRVSQAEPGTETCGNCHNGLVPDTHPASPDFYHEYLNSAHTNTVNTSVVNEAGEVLALCSKCHTDQGGREHKAKDGTSSTLPGQFTGVANVASPEAVQCRTCHNAHNPSEMLESATAATDTAKARSAEFNTCTNCHQLLDSDDSKISGYHSFGIVTTHYDDPTDKGDADNDETIEGYNVMQGSEDACAVCHDPHKTDLTINKQWAESGHGDLKGAAWAHYDWDCSEENKPGEGSACSRASCWKCHTASGFAAYAHVGNDAYNTALGAYQADASSNDSPVDFSHLKDDQNEVLYCWSCHSDSKFNMRTVSAATFPSGKTADLGDSSNLCMTCHSGRAAGADVDETIANDPAGPYGFTNIHYYVAAATYLGSDVGGGYEYTGKTYAGKSTFTAHTSANKVTCIGCHLRDSDSPDHTFEPKVADCSTCHSGLTEFSQLRPAAASADYDGDGNTSEGMAAEIAGLEDALYAAIQAYGRANTGPVGYAVSSYPYWFKDTNDNGTIEESEASYSNGYKFDATLLKAAYNFQVSKKDPNGYIHNWRYVTQLLYDSIDALGGDTSKLTRP